MPAAVVDRHVRRWKARVGEGTDGDAYKPVMAFFGVEDGRAADRTEAESEPGSAIACSHVFAGVPDYLERRSEARKCCESAAGPSLARQAMTQAHAAWFAFDLDSQLAAAARCYSGRH